jgi:hypothetical protein
MRYSGTLLNVDDVVEADVPQHKDAVVCFRFPSNTSMDAVMIEGLLRDETEFITINPVGFGGSESGYLQGITGQSYSGAIMIFAGKWLPLFAKVRARKYGIGTAPPVPTEIPVSITISGLGV